MNRHDELKPSPWDRYRWWRKIFWVCLPACGSLFLLINLIFDRPPEILFVILLPIAISSMALDRFRCPRCDGLFFRGFWYQPGATHCVHCGLPKWQDASYAGPSLKDAYPTPREHRAPVDPKIAERAKLSRFLTLVLKEDPRALGLKLDADGWTDVDHLITRANRYGIELDRDSLLDVCNHHPVFEWNQATGRIRYNKSSLPDASR